GQTIAGMAAIIPANIKFAEAMAAKFPDAGAKPKNLKAEFTEHLNAMDEKIDGDAAVLTAADSDQRVSLKKADGAWKVEFASLPQEKLNKMPPAQMQQVAKAFNAVAENIAAGKYSSPEEVQQALAAQMMSV